MFTIGLYLIIGFLFVRLVVALEKDNPQVLPLPVGLFAMVIWPLALFLIILDECGKGKFWEKVSKFLFGGPKE